MLTPVLPPSEAAITLSGSICASAPNTVSTMRNPVSPRAALVYNGLGGKLALKYIFSMAYVAPAPYFGQNVFDNGVQISGPNPDLKPEKATSNEINATFKTSKLLVSASGYYNYQSNLLVTAQSELPETIAEGGAGPTVIVVRTRDVPSRQMFEQRANQAETMEAAERAAATGRSVPARVDRWFEQMRLLKTRLRNVGKYYKEGKEIKATHESILAERSGLSANNISIVFKVQYCRFGRIKGS